MSKTSTQLQQLEALGEKALKKFEAISALEELQDFYQLVLGKKSLLNELLRSLKFLSTEEKKEIGPKIQEFKTYWQEQYEQKAQKLESESLDKLLKEDTIDVTKEFPQEKGALHPLSIIQRKVEQVFAGMGFEIADGPEVETEWYNFDALNIPSSHPARDMQDTFFVNSKDKDPHKNSVLRTQTSNVQIRTMLERGAPLRVIAPGRVYRNEDVDATHDASFYQVEGLLVDKDITVAHLKGVIETMLSKVFERPIKTRIRPGYFPFVEPGLEFDIWWEFIDKNKKKQGQWLEFMGGGMVHPQVLTNGGVDSEIYSGFAFGFGLTRLVMMYYGIEDIRLLFSHRKEFLKQF